MIIGKNKTAKRGQTALIMILLTAAALIFLSITLNWGRIAQVKSLLTIAADQAASLLASDAASYGEMEKQQNLQDTNEISQLSGIIMDIILIVIIIIVLIITICTGGAGALLFIVIALAMAVVNLILTLTVIQPGMCALWNKLQKNQPITQQFYEGGVGAALQGSITDQVNVTDYFDSNTNGKFGLSTAGLPKDIVGRFALFYTDRLKMLNKGDIPQVDFFYNQLTEFMGGESCAQNALEHDKNPGIPINPICTNMETKLGINCDAASASIASENPSCLNPPAGSPVDPSCTDAACQMPVPNGFQLNDSCTDSDLSNSTSYNPYCDPCCQPLLYNGKGLRPTSCYPYTAGYPESCYSKPNGSTCVLTATCTASPNSDCCLPSPSSKDASCLVSTGAPGECSTNNPFGPAYPYLYDPTYQEYSNGKSFLDQFGRDQQQVTGALPLTTMTTQGDFPNGLYPFFWLMSDYSTQVNNLTSGYTASTPSVNPSVSQYHWCVAHTATNQVNAPTGYSAPASTTLTEFPELNQLGSSIFPLPYGCKGPNCCTNFLINSDPSGTGIKSATKSITVGSGPSIFITAPAASANSYTSGQSLTITAKASETSPGSVSNIAFNITGQGLNYNLQSKNFTPYPFTPGTDVSITGTVAVPGCTNAVPPLVPSVALPATGNYTLYATATDSNGNTGSADVTMTINNPNGSSCTGGDNCGADSCGNLCNGVSAACRTTGDTCCADSGSSGPGVCHATCPSAPPEISAKPGISINQNPTSPSVANVNASSDNTSASGSSNQKAQLNVNLTSSVTVSSQFSTYPKGSNITITATVSNFAATEVSFFDRSNNFLGVVYGSGPTYSITLNNVQSSFSVYASADNGSTTAATSTSNGTMDEVGNLYLSDLVYNQNLAADTTFGEPMSSTNPTANPWQGGDNQMCSISWPYNGKSSYFPDGSCEWTGTVVNKQNVPSQYPSVDTSKSTIDNLDEVMHTMSDFDKFALSITDKDLGTLNSTFDSWYPSAAAWFAPACSQSSGTSECSSTDSIANAAACTFTEAQFDNGGGSNLACNAGSNNGRLLSIYDPNPGTSVDVLKDWNTVTKEWLENNYASSSAYCVPPQSTLSLFGTNEEAYITNNSAIIAQNSPISNTWGNLPHVIACLNYNAGPTQAQESTVNYSNYQNCLNQLTSGACPSDPPDVCASSILGNSPSDTPPAFNGPTSCNVYQVGSFANWVSNHINFGPVYNYQNCLNLLANSCPSSLANTACDSSYLGRTLLNPTSEPKPNFTGSCKLTNCTGGTMCGSGGIGKCASGKACTVTFAQWVNDSMNLFIDENSKFIKRAEYLTDIYSRAQSMQNIFSAGDVALHNFLKTCTGCADGSSCAGGICSGDGSACGAPPSCPGHGQCPISGQCSDGSSCNYCANGGPASQLMWARTLGNPSRTLPNSVVYGWIDRTLANGQTLAAVPCPATGICPNDASCVQGSQCTGVGSGGTGYAHIVRVTAYSPGRDAGGPAGLQSLLPNVHSWTTFFDQKYALANRDGNVYVRIQRWDQDHTNATNFPNGHPLWQFMFHNSSGTAGNGIPSSCFALSGAGISNVGFGLESTTLQGLKLAISQQGVNDTTTVPILGQAFMLNDSGDGSVDANAKNNTQYASCMSQVSALLSTGTESHACARYVAAVNGDDPSQNGDGDYSLKFIDCNSIVGGNTPTSSP